MALLQWAAAWWNTDKGKKENGALLHEVTWPTHGREQLDVLPQNGPSPTGVHGTDCARTDGLRQSLAGTATLVFHNGIAL